MVINQWNARRCCSVAMARLESSLHLTEATHAFTTSCMKIGVRVGVYMVFPTFLTSLAYMMMSRGRMT